MRKGIWLIWIVFSVALVTGLAYLLFFADDKNALLIGEATHGHHQIEMACEACHTSSFGGPEVLQDACVGCHQEELENSHDSHPKKKFTNPRNAELAKKLDASKCVTCHVEHQLEQTRAIGVTVPEDVCFHCHEKVVEQRETHRELSFDTCATSGCHNFHDNRALYESFLVKNSGKPWVDYTGSMPVSNNAKRLAPKGKGLEGNGIEIKGIEVKQSQTSLVKEITKEWEESGHATSGVVCVDCHNSESNSWVEKPDIAVCGNCHKQEFKGFVSSKHGMRLSPELPEKLTAMSPALGRLDFNDHALDAELSCNSCHAPHKPNLRKAAVESCLGCHSDQHSESYMDSPHARLWKAELSGEGEKNSGVTCATCHLPTEQHKQIVDKELRLKKVSVQHNQNVTLRPNEKMIRPVCMQCHSLEFSIDALADEALILNNFSGKPSVHIKSVDWALERDKR